MSPPPKQLPGAHFGRELAFLALGGFGGIAALGHSPNDSPDDHMKVRVKHTFIDVVEEPGSPLSMRAAQSCTARYSMSAQAARMLLPSPKAGSVSPPQPLAAPSIVVTQAPPTEARVAPGSIAPVSSPACMSPASAAAAPSPGSADHGKFDSHGEALCQPCAWFYKGSGCQNGATCRRCHICPEGELKLRKKQKIAKLRNQEGTAPGDLNSPAPSSAAGTPPQPGAAEAASSPQVSPEARRRAPHVQPPAPMQYVPAGQVLLVPGPPPGGRAISPNSTRWADIANEPEEVKVARGAAQKQAQQRQVGHR